MTRRSRSVDVHSPDPVAASGDPSASELFRDLYEHAPVAYFSVAPDGRIRLVNRRARELLGYEPSDLVGRSPVDLYADTPDGRPKADELQRRALQGEDLVDQELQMRRADGEVIWVSLTVHPVRDENGDVVERRGAVLDITERKRTEAALRESEERFHKIFEHSNDGIMVLEPEADRIVEANARAAGMLGYSHDELLELPISAIHPDEMPRLREFVQGVYEHGSDRTDELTCLTKGGAKLAAEISASTVVVDGRHRMIAAIRDVTDRRRAEEALRRAHDQLEERVRARTAELTAANERLHAEIRQRQEAEEAQRHYARRLETLQEIDRAILAAGSPREIAEAAVRHVERLIHCSRASVALLDEEAGQWLVITVQGQSAEGMGVGTRLPLDAFGDAEEIEHLRRGDPHLVSDVDTERDAAAVTRLRSHGLRSYLTVPLLAQDHLIGALNLGDDRVDAFDGDAVEIAREVSDSLAIGIQHARLHERLEQHAGELERRVAERTAELESFSYSVSHDLRAPLRAIDGFSRMVLEDHAEGLDDEGHRLLGVVRESTHKMGALIDDLLAFSRLGRQELRVAEAVDLEELARTVFDELVPSNAKRNVDFRVGPMPPACGDPTMLRQVLTNLLANALKYTRPRDRAVIEVGAEVADGETTVYYVRDNGVGFEMEYADKIFGVFQRLHGGEEFEGTGVGLPIVQRVVERHGGRTWAEGRPGEGATIRFTLPQE